MPQELTRRRGIFHYFRALQGRFKLIYHDWRVTRFAATEESVTGGAPTTPYLVFPLSITLNVTGCPTQLAYMVSDFILVTSNAVYSSLLLKRL